MQQKSPIRRFHYVLACIIFGLFTTFVFALRTIHESYSAELVEQSVTVVADEAEISTPSLEPTCGVVVKYMMDIKVENWLPGVIFVAEFESKLLRHLCCNLLGLDNRIFQSIVFICNSEQTCEFLRKEKVPYLVERPDLTEARQWDDFRIACHQEILATGRWFASIPTGGFWLRNLLNIHAMKFTIDPDVFIFGDWGYPLIYFRNGPELLPLWPRNQTYETWKKFVEKMWSSGVLYQMTDYDPIFQRHWASDDKNIDLELPLPAWFSEKKQHKLVGLYQHLSMNTLGADSKCREEYSRNLHSYPKFAANFTFCVPLPKEKISLETLLISFSSLKVPENLRVDLRFYTPSGKLNSHVMKEIEKFLVWNHGLRLTRNKDGLNPVKLFAHSCGMMKTNDTNAHVFITSHTTTMSQAAFDRALKLSKDPPKATVFTMQYQGAQMILSGALEWTQFRQFIEENEDNDVAKKNVEKKKNELSDSYSNVEDWFAWWSFWSMATETRFHIESVS